MNYSKCEVEDHRAKPLVGCCLLEVLGRLTRGTFPAPALLLLLVLTSSHHLARLIFPKDRSTFMTFLHKGLHELSLLSKFSKNSLTSSSLFSVSSIFVLHFLSNHCDPSRSIYIIPRSLSWMLFFLLMLFYCVIFQIGKILEQYDEQHILIVQLYQILILCYICFRVFFFNLRKQTSLI